MCSAAALTLLVVARATEQSRMAWTRLLLLQLATTIWFLPGTMNRTDVPDLHRLRLEAPHWSPRPATLEARSALIWGTSVQERPRASHNSGRKSPCEKALADTEHSPHVTVTCSVTEAESVCTASNTLRPKRLPIHIGSAGERARPPVQSFFVPDQMNRTEPNREHD
jgi:hypothetical protein